MLRGDRLGLRSFGSTNYLRMIKRVVSIMSIWKQQISQEVGIFVSKKHELLNIICLTSQHYLGT